VEVQVVRPTRGAPTPNFCQQSVFRKVFRTRFTLQDVQTTAQKKGPDSRAFLVGAYRDRTGDLRLAKPALSQLS
jgi:hypothetical protein